MGTAAAVAEKNGQKRKRPRLRLESWDAREQPSPRTAQKQGRSWAQNRKWLASAIYVARSGYKILEPFFACFCGLLAVFAIQILPADPKTAHLDTAPAEYYACAFPS